MVIIHYVPFFQEYKQQAMDYFINKLKSSSEDSEIQGQLNGIRGMVALFGPAIAKPYEKLFQKYKSDGTTMYIKDVATDLLDDMAGRRYIHSISFDDLCVNIFQYTNFPLLKQ